MQHFKLVLVFPQNESTQKSVPGPGTHENKVVIDPKGKYYFSHHRNSKAKTFNPAHSKRFSQSTTDFPGPGNYKPKNDLPEDGNYVLSKNKSARKRAFLMGKRGSFVDEMPKRVLSKNVLMQHLDQAHIDLHQTLVSMIRLRQLKQDISCQRELKGQRQKVDKIKYFSSSYIQSVFVFECNLDYFLFISSFKGSYFL